MTEDEAKTKWCPAFRGNDHGMNRPLEVAATPPGYCIGSACMAWRVSNAKLGHNLDHQTWSHGKVEGEKRHREFLRANPLQGYCGLAGGIA